MKYDSEKVGAQVPAKTDSRDEDAVFCTDRHALLLNEIVGLNDEHKERNAGQTKTRVEGVFHTSFQADSSRWAQPMRHRRRHRRGNENDGCEDRQSEPVAIEKGMKAKVLDVMFVAFGHSLASVSHARAASRHERIFCHLIEAKGNGTDHVIHGFREVWFDEKALKLVLKATILYEKTEK